MSNQRIGINLKKINHKICIISIGVLCMLCTLLFLSACSPKASNESTEANFVNIEDAKKSYLNNKDVSQLACVRYTEGSNAIFDYYIKEDKEWKLDFSCNAYVGKTGIGKAKEGETNTPAGDFPIGDAFGILPNPGTSLKYINVTNTTFACDEEGPYYNQIIDTKETNHDCKGEEMSTIVPQYNYGLQIKYNPNNVYPEGSAIFLHCIGNKTYTGGCVAIPQENMENLLKKVDPSMHIIISNN